MEPVHTSLERLRSELHQSPVCLLVRFRSIRLINCRRSLVSFKYALVRKTLVCKKESRCCPNLAVIDPMQLTIGRAGGVMGFSCTFCNNWIDIEKILLHINFADIFIHRELRELWNRLRKERPELLANFEDFLFRVSTHIRDVHHEKETLEQALKRKETDHGREVRSLYEEMEQQIKIERERLQRKDSTRQQDRQTTLQRELLRKEQELEGIVLRQRQLENQLHSLNSEQLETRVQNDRLRQLNEDLIEQLERTKTNLGKAQANLMNLRKQEQEEQECKKRDAYKVSQNIQKEKQSLLRQLELLRDINKKLRDEKDVFEAKKLDNLKKNPAVPMLCVQFAH
ncbi:hypothetical protein AB205_0186510 [Aquarana catesbeiana]|uniref:Uncharacterized protein n=1 Tax=Aquarana catesbeiana TaxID=8400 RepID=A0A2G9SBG1_AQUCT|nr:hypothetical protein AB205_0186510 [Aquarana catesbeiana]